MDTESQDNELSGVMEAVFTSAARSGISVMHRTPPQESPTSWYKVEVTETEKVTSRDIWVAYDTEQETLPLKIIDYLETNYRLRCYFDKRDSDAGEFKSGFLDRTMRECSYFILCFTEDFYSKNKALCAHALQYFEEKSDDKRLFILKIDEKCEIPRTLKTVSTIISLIGENISAPLGRLVFLLLGIDPDISCSKLLDSRFLGFHPSDTRPTTRFYECRHLNCKHQKVCFSSLPHEYSKDFLHVKFIVSPLNTPYLIWQTQLSEEIYNNVFRQLNPDLVRCFQSMFMASYISVQMFGDNPSFLQFNVVNKSRQLIGCRIDQLRLIYSDSVSPVGADWNDVTDNANLRTDATSGFYTFDAYKTGIYLVCARKTDREEEFFPTLVVCLTSRNIDQRFRRLGLHWDWDVRVPMHDRHLDISIFNMTLSHQDSLDYMLRFNSSSIVIDSGPKLYVTLFYMDGDHVLFTIPLTMDLCESLETFSMTLEPSLAWQLVAEFYVDADRNQHLTTITISEKSSTTLPKLTELISTLQSDDDLLEASSLTYGDYLFVNQPGRSRATTLLFLSQATHLLQHIWRCVLTDESLPPAAEITVSKRNAALINQIKGDSIPDEILTNLHRQPAGLTRKVNIRSKLLLRVIEQLIIKTNNDNPRLRSIHHRPTQGRREASPVAGTANISVRRQSTSN